MEATITKTFTVHECSVCSVTYAITTRFDTEARKDLRTFYCPNGHAQGYSKSTADILRDDIATKQRSITELQDRVNTLTTHVAALERKQKRKKRR